MTLFLKLDCYIKNMSFQADEYYSEDKIICIVILKHDEKILVFKVLNIGARSVGGWKQNWQSRNLFSMLFSQTGAGTVHADGDFYPNLINKPLLW